MYTLRVCFPSGHKACIGRPTGHSDVFQGALGTFRVSSDYGLCHRQVQISSFDS